MSSAVDDGRPLRVLTLVEPNHENRSWPAQIELLRDRNVDVTACTVVEPGPFHEQLAANDCRSFSLRCRSARDYPVGAGRLARIVHAVQADVLHLVEPIAAAVGGAGGVIAGRGVRIFHRQHVFIDKPMSRLSQVGARLAHLTMAVCEAAAEAAIADDGARRERTAVAYNGVPRPRAVEDAELAAMRERLGIPEEAPVISVVARLRPEKGLDVLIDAFPQVNAQLSQPAHLVVAGSGSAERDLRERAQAVDGGTIHFVGHQDDVAPWFSVGDVVAMPSRREALSFAGAEAMGCGRPLVASAVGGLKELVLDGETGVLVAPDDPVLLADALVGLLGSPDSRRQMGERARSRFLEHFTVEAMVDGWVRCYERALREARR